jgi:hypothetical protein
MGTTPTTKSGQPVDVAFAELSSEILGLAQKYINEGAGDENIRNAIRGILMWAASLTTGLQQALQR